MSRWDTEKVLREDEALLRAVETLEKEQPEEESPPAPDPAEVGAKILEDLVAFIRRFIYLTVNQAIVLGLWVLHTHAFAAAMHNPIMHVFSPEKESGKTRLLEVMELLVHKGWLVDRASAAALIRKIAKDAPALLHDEVDVALGGDKEYAETLRGILNSVHRRGKKIAICVKAGANWKLLELPVFCPVMLSGLGRLPDTVNSRAIPIRLQRKPKMATVEKFYFDEAKPQADELRKRANEWCRQQVELLKKARPKMPAELSDRQTDSSTPLVAIANLLEGEWPIRAQDAIVELCTSKHAEDQSLGVRLLTDIAGVFSSTKYLKLSSEELATCLTEIETSPWAEYKHGKPLTKYTLAPLLKPFDITPRTIRLDAQSTPRGYRIGMFVDAWERYAEVPQELLNDARKDSLLMQEEEAEK